VSFYVTTPIYYVNARPHLGHAYTTIAADIASRHMRQRGEDVFFLTGTDEHSSAPAKRAAEEGITPQEFVDRSSAVFRQLASDLQATNDFFIRTTDAGHKEFVQGFLERLRANGHVYEGTYAGLYCDACEAFYRENELVDGKCPIHGTEPRFLEERNWFFRLSAFAEPLLAHYDAQRDFVVPRSRYNEARSFIEAGLDDVSLSRASVQWGIPLPWDPEQTIYVWFDALLNYTSALTYARPGEDLTARYWPARWQLLAKDILKFHAVIWPAMLLGAGYALPRQLLIHGYLTVRDEKMSKTKGNVLDPFRVIDHYGLDALRYYLFRDVRFGGDGAVSYDSVHERYHADLANDLGNLVNRSVAMIDRYRAGTVPDAETAPAIADVLTSSVTRFAEHVERFELTEAIEAAWESIRALNRFVEEQAPWTLAKDPERAGELDTVLATLADGVRVVAILLASLMPGTAARMLQAVGAGDGTSWELAAPGQGAPDARVEVVGALFPRIDEPIA
jgi:methionyl-tRNA synthetase